MTLGNPLTDDDAIAPPSPDAGWSGAGLWLYKNLLSPWYNALLTLLCVLGIVQVLRWGLGWVFGVAQWQVIQTNLPLFFVGRYPPELGWRVGLALGVAIALTLVSVVKIPRISGVKFALWPVGAIVILWLIGGGLGLEPVETNLWNGLMLTLILAVFSIVLAFPLGVLLALGRQSSLPVMRWLSIFYIEIIRGLPLIGILFLAQVMLPLFLPMEWRWDRLVRAIAGLVIFNSAYLAENVRGGLQTVPRGQIEAARALGLNPLWMMTLIVLPQALKAVIPAIVGQFISLFKDTSLLSLFALVELIGMARSILSQPEFLGRYGEVYLFVGLIYWIFCFSLSQASQYLERKLRVGDR